ncbi:hypothetical protein, partial [Enterococcus casseliflavus]|uniref:hypothetical protein n=1 Tax=Enterococcus casseliflavus TaxID=37734 RepID=UPI003D1437C1
GNAADNIAKLGSLTQITRSKGGAATATQAATSVLNLMASLSKGEQRAAFKKHGVEVEGAGGKLRGPQEIILDALQKTGGDSAKMG